MGYWEIEFLAYYGVYYLPGVDRDGCASLRGKMAVYDVDDIQEAIARTINRAKTFGFDKVHILNANWIAKEKEEVTE